MANHRLSSAWSSGEATQFNDFRTLSCEVADLGRMAGVTIIPFRDEKLPHFSKLSVKGKSDVLDQLRVLIGICDQAIKGNGSLSDPLRLLWSAVRHLGLRPSSDLFDQLQPESIFEISNGTYQSYRSFSYFKFCSYSLEDLYCRPWTALYERNETLNRELLDVIDRTKASKQINRGGPGAHRIAETDSVMRFKLNYRLEFMAPLFGQNTKEVSHVLVGIDGSFAER